MSKKAVVRLAAVALMFAAGSASALDSKNLTVTAKVVGTCQLLSNVTAAFGTLTQVGAVDQQKLVTVQYRCTTNTAPTSFTVGASASPFAGTMKNLANDPMPYKVTWTNPTTAGSGLGTGVTPVDVVLTVDLLAVDFANAPAGDYTQTVAVEINN